MKPLPLDMERHSTIKTHSGQTRNIVGPAIPLGDDVPINISRFGTTTSCENDLLRTQAANLADDRRLKVGSG